MTQLKLPWDVNISDDDQRRYRLNKRYMYQKAFEGCRGLRVVKLEKTDISNEEDQDKVYESILHGKEAKINERILIGTFGAI